MRLLLAAGIALMATTAVADAQSHVRGYIRRDGTYVQPHVRSAPDGNPYNNWSSQPNVNPYNGRHGNVDPNAIPRSTYPTAPQYRPYVSPLPALPRYNDTGRRIF